ncbi:porin [Noviherbaspirillum soli]|uniref:porin n=1 Tax=Noviherbaspirillum soli TaxID=1064518 RepID=UPI00188C7D99|nr:porin [Noviherbaspirillum soli]
MKKSLLALAVLGAFAGVAQAQTSVTIYGSFDAGVRNQRDIDAAGHSRTTMSSTGTYNSNRLGFKGVEDLGGGLNAHFTLESGFNSGTGELNNTQNRLFQRSAFVGLGGQWGSLDLGRQYTVAFKTVGAYDPFNYKFTGIIPLTGASVSAGTRVDNDIQYTGTFGPITARAEYALGEQVGGGGNNSHAAIGGTYANGPLSFGAAYTARKPNVATGTAPANFQDNKNWTVGGAFTFGPARIAAGYQNEKQDRATGGDAGQKNAWVGGSYDITPALGLTAAYYHTKVDANAVGVGNTTAGKRGLFIVGATYALSKRTNFYADIDYAKYKDGLETPSTGTNTILTQSSLRSAPGQDSMLGFSVGINHLF